MYIVGRIYQMNDKSTYRLTRTKKEERMKKCTIQWGMRVKWEGMKWKWSEMKCERKKWVTAKLRWSKMIYMHANWPARTSVWLRFVGGALCTYLRRGSITPLHQSRSSGLRIQSTTWMTPLDAGMSARYSGDTFTSTRRPTKVIWFDCY